jgi:calpain-7
LIAVELYMNVTKLTSDVSEKARLRSECTRLLSRAEDIKKAAQWPPPVANSILLKVPLSTRELSKREQIILLEGSKLHGFIFPPWKSEPEDGVFEELHNGKSYYT